MKMYGKLIRKKFLIALTPLIISLLVTSLLSVNGILMGDPICEGTGAQQKYCEEPIGP